MKTKAKTVTKTKLKKELDKVFSIFIRKRDKGVCISCGVKKDIKEMQCGHYISRGNMSTRWDEENCYCQCVSCNVFKNGNYPAFTVALQRKFGDDFPKKLYKRGKKVKQWTTKEIKELIEHYG